MPDKPKRRKNNKNKRKNKQNRPDFNKFTNIDANESGTSETCSVQSELLEDCGSSEIRQETISLENNANNTVLLSDNLQGDEQSLEQNCNCNENLNQDLNNNSENTTSNHCTPNNMDDIQISENYIVEPPQEQSHSKSKYRNKFKDQIKSKSLDHDDEPKIQEILDCQDENTIEIIDSNGLVSDVESDIEWEKINEDPKMYTEELATGTLSITTIPLNSAQCEQPKALTSDKEKSLRHYLQSLNLSINPSVSSIEIKTEIEQMINREIRHRLSKKGSSEDFITAKLGPPRILDVIDEESSESSRASQRQSYLSDIKSDNDDLDDDVFEEPKTKPPLAMKPNITRKPKPLGRLVPQECVLVGTKLKEAEVAEARGNWTVQTVEKMKGAEVVYLTDSSSSTSSIHELSEETENGEDTDVTIRMLTPTIEVTDTDSLLKKTYVADDKDELQAISQKKYNLNENLVTDSENQQNGTKQGTVSKNEKIDISTHEIVVTSTDNIKTNLFVKDIDNINPSEDNSVIAKLHETTDNTTDENKTSQHYNSEIKALKSELNDAITNLIKEVCSDSETNDNPKDNFVRQDSSSSIGSSQCTAKYNPTQSSLNDVSNMHDEAFENVTSGKLNITSHVKDVFQCVTGLSTQTNGTHDYKVKQPAALRDICVGKIASLPYGEKILEELASVSEQLQHINKHIIATDKTAISAKERLVEKMPYYPLPDLSRIEKISLSTKPKEPHPPPRNSSLKQPQDDQHWTAIPTKTEPVYVCLSPSQKMLMEKTNTVVTKEDASQLVNMPKKFLDRRGYNEPSNKMLYNEFERNDPPIVPFKSQTGSRLLALIQNPSVNMNSVTKDFSYSCDQIKNHDDIRKFGNYIQSFKPIPPPRPKKYSSSFYESDESSDFTDNSHRSFKSEKKFFHYSTGNLSKDIENDISSIQNMHRYYKSVREKSTDPNKPRRPSLPKDLCDQQMEYIKQKEKEVEAEIKRLEREKVSNALSDKRGPRAPLMSEKEMLTEKRSESNNYMHQCNTKNLPLQSEKRIDTKLSSLFSSSQEELLREKMYSEYVTQMAQRQERKQHKIIKITNPSRTINPNSVSRSMSALDILDSKVNNRIEKEFMSRARERWNKLGITDPDTEDEKDKENGLYREPTVIEHKIKVIEGGEERDVQKLPSHLQDFVNFTAKQKEHGQSSSGESGGPASPHVVVWCAVIVLVLAVVRYILRMLRNM